MSIAWAGAARGVATRSFAQGLQAGERMWHIYAETYALCRELHQQAPPGLVWVEQPFGINVPIVSYLAMSAVMMAVHRVTGTPIVPVGPPYWKRRSVGAGNAKKPAILAWAREHGYTGTLQDEADAWGLAHAAYTSASPLVP